MATPRANIAANEDNRPHKLARIYKSGFPAGRHIRVKLEKPSSINFIQVGTRVNGYMFKISRFFFD